LAEQLGSDRRIPVGLAVELRFGELGAAPEATTRDVSKTGMCVVVAGLPGGVEKALAEGAGADVLIGVALGRKRVELPGKITWQRKVGHGEWVVGVEYAGAPDIAAAVTAYAEHRLHRPRVVRGMAFAAALVLACFAAFFFWYEDDRAEELASIDQKLSEATRLRTESAGHLEALRGEIAALRASTTSSAEELATKQKQLAAVQSKFETLRQQVGELSVSRENLKAQGAPSGMEHLERGHRFSKENNLAAALIEYQRAVELVPDLAEAHLEIAVINDLYGRPAEAIESYRRYLALRPNALDAYEIRSTIKELESETQGTR
jgi:hypothetical protein